MKQKVQYEIKTNLEKQKQNEKKLYYYINENIFNNQFKRMWRTARRQTTRVNTFPEYQPTTNHYYCHNDVYDMCLIFAWHFHSIRADPQKRSGGSVSVMYIQFRAMRAAQAPPYAWTTEAFLVRHKCPQ